MKANGISEFESRVSRADGCFIWQGAVSSSGYGVFRYQRKLWHVHRLSWLFYRGADPGESQVLHLCDVRTCVNPAHLYLGDHADNMRDMATRGRAAAGSRNGNSKLTLAAVTAIRNDQRGSVEIAREYGVTKEQVWNIRTGKQWRQANG